MILTHAVAGLLLAGIAIPGCATFAVRTTQEPARNVPQVIHGIGPGPITSRALQDAGWAQAEKSAAGRLYVLATAERRGGDVEAWVAPGTPGGAGAGGDAVHWVRVRHPHGRLSTYQRLLDELVGAHGPPQVSEEVRRFDHFARDFDADRPLPSRFVVHRWRGSGRELLLVAGLEATENLAAGMEYQLFLMPYEEAPPPAAASR